MRRKRILLPLVLVGVVGLLGCRPTDPGPPGPVAESPWGVAPSTGSSRTTGAWVDPMASIGVTSVRGFDSGSDLGVSPHLAAGLDVTGILMWSPPGAPLTVPANDLDGWERYVTETVTKYRGKVTTWEVWNEPPNFTADVSPASYGRVVARAYDAVKAVDPGIRVAMATKSVHVNWLAQAIEGGAAGKYDIITLHPYEVAGLVPGGFEGGFMGIVPTVRTMLRDKDPSKAGVPIWFTEVGTHLAMDSRPDRGGVTEAVQADQVVKVYSMGIAQGVGKIFWYDPTDGDHDPRFPDTENPFGLIAKDGRRRPAFIAMQTLIANLGTRPDYRGWTLVNGRQYGFVYQGPRGTVLSTWARPGTTEDVTFPGPVTRIDPKSGQSTTGTRFTLTASPSLFVAGPGPASEAWSASAAASRGSAFPWDGDHHDGGSVSLTAGSPDRGLHWLGRPAATDRGGALAYDVSGGSGASFRVDPTFLSYTTRPIRITAVLRANGDGSAGFNLKYESNRPTAAVDGNGLVSVPNWNSVREGDFYEQSWVIDDPRFVGYFGYNFTFDSDSTQHSHYSIRSVTVTKL